jgi:hypothetical protein
MREMGEQALTRKEMLEYIKMLENRILLLERKNRELRYNRGKVAEPKKDH